MENKKTNPVFSLDTQTAIMRLGGHKEIYIRMLRYFEPEFSDIADKIDLCLKSSDHKTAVRLAHSTKGAAGNIGSTALWDIAFALEKAIAHKDSSIEDCLVAFRKQLTVTVTAVSDFLAAENQTLKK
jgi:two-component system sensor histidine kinase/response regulator